MQMVWESNWLVWKSVGIAGTLCFLFSTQENCVQPCCKEYYSFRVATVQFFGVSGQRCGLLSHVYSSGDCCTLGAHSLVTDQFLCFALENCSDCLRRFLQYLICVQVGFEEEVKTGLW